MNPAFKSQARAIIAPTEGWVRTFYLEYACQYMAAQIAKAAHANGTTLREEAVKLGFVSGKEFDRLVQPARMTRPDA